jgi:hypothetical protein
LVLVVVCWREEHRYLSRSIRINRCSKFGRSTLGMHPLGKLLQMRDDLIRSDIELVKNI